MEGIYGLHRAVDFGAGQMTAEDLQGLLAAAGRGGGDGPRDRVPTGYGVGATAVAVGGEDEREGMKARIASHPGYPRLLEAYVDCQKVGAPPAITSLLDEIRRENEAAKRSTVSTLLGADPELDEFMETYCDVLVKYRSDLARPFDEATAFLNSIEMQLSDLCKGPCRTRPFVSVKLDEAAGLSEEEFSGGEIEVQEAHLNAEDSNLKNMLLRKYSGYLSSLKQEFSKKKKKGKLPKDARQILLNWWNAHYKWPYPTEADKIALADSTGLDQKQINNWFINQRKRHWKPSENMQFGIMGSLSAPFFVDG